MNKLKTLISLFLILLVFAQCTRENAFLIEKNRVGLISNVNIISDLESIFSNDSIVKNLSEGELGGKDTRFIQDNDEYLIYSKEGKHLMTIVPENQHDTSSKIKYVQIMDAQFITEKGLSLNSPFKDINVNYMINKIETTFLSATIYIDELNVTIALDKNEIGVNQFSTKEIKIEQIPDLTKIKYFTIWFD